MEASSRDKIQIKTNPTKGRFIIRWNSPDGVKASLRLAAPMIATPKVDEIRTVSYTIYDLDAVGEDDIAFTPKTGGVASTAFITSD